MFFQAKLKTEIKVMESKAREMEARIHQLEDENHRLSAELDALHNNTMTLAMGITDYFTVIQEVGGGNLTVVSNENAGDDLLNQLSRVTNKMIASLRDLITEVRSIVHQCTMSADTLARVSEQSSQAVTHLASTITQISGATVSIAQNSQVASVPTRQAGAAANF